MFVFYTSYYVSSRVMMLERETSGVCVNSWGMNMDGHSLMSHACCYVDASSLSLSDYRLVELTSYIAD